MHRSGTSALAGALHKLGADLGPESAWLSPAADNPRGFFEYAPMVDMNRRILAALGGTWSSPPPLPEGWIDDERLVDLRPHVQELSIDMRDGMVVKDPRLSLVLPLWGSVGRIPAGMLCLRHPNAVANSLGVRNQFTIDQSLFLWFRYNAAAILNCPDALIVEYESLLENPVKQLNRTAEHIGLEVSDKTVENAARAVYRGMAHHHGGDLPQTPIGLICRDLYRLFQSGEILDTNSQLGIWARLATELPWAGPGEHEINRIRREAEESNLKLDRLPEDNKKLERRVQRLETELRYALNMVDIVSISETADLLRSEHREPQ